jgi:hypothetical protein
MSEMRNAYALRQSLWTDLYYLAGKTLHRMVPSENGRVFGDECAMPP